MAEAAIDDPDQDGEPDLLADDVRRVLEAAVGKVPAHVFGSSGGAVTGLALVARYPEHVETLIAHEAPLALLLPEAEQARAAFHQIDDTYRERGMSAAWQAFASFTGLTIAQQDPAADPPPPSPQEVATSTRFFEHGLLPIALYQPDFAALQAAPTRLIVAGERPRGVSFRSARPSLLPHVWALPLMDFPGGHAGFTTEPGEFASVLRRAVA